jgi:predicted ATPase
VLQRELAFAPQEETVAVYHDVLADRSRRRKAPSTQSAERAGNWRIEPARLVSAAPFVGRDNLVAELCHQLAHPAQGGGMVLVTGEAGVGKTRLLEEVAKTAADQGAVVLWGGGGASETNFVCGPFAVALEGYVAPRPVAERRELARRYPALSGLVPSLVSETAAAHALAAPGEHREVVPAIVRLLTDTAREHPVLLVLDDLRKADGYSLDIVGYLAHLASERRMLMIASVREEEVEPGSAVARLLANVMREGLCRRLELQCLSRAQCHELVAAIVPSTSVSRRLLDQIYELSRGNPMFVRELAQEVRALGQPGDAGTGARAASVIADQVPSQVRALVEMQLSSLDSSTRRVLWLVAAAGTTEVSFADLRAGAAALDPPVGDGALLDALDRAVETRLLEERGHGYAFRHPLVRSALYERLSHHRRAQLGGALQHSSAHA